jgi:SAM-dependent methyltransferase
MIYKRPESVEISESYYRALYGTELLAKQRLYNIGAGAWSHPCWTNIDLPAQTEAFAKIQAPCIHHDLIKQPVLPIPTGVVDAVFCSHVVEHLPDAVVKNLMKEVHRCLDKGGVFRIVTGPCADLDWAALMRGDEKWWYWFEEADFKRSINVDLGPMTIYDQWLFSVATPRSLYSATECSKKYNSHQVKELITAHKGNPEPLLDSLTHSLGFSHAFPGNHISWWNYKKLSAFLGEAGFKNVCKSGYGQSTSAPMRDLRYFDKTYPQISVYVDAVK